MTHVIVDPGVCGLTADIRAEAADMGEVNIAVETKCPMIAKLVEDLGGQVVKMLFVMELAGLKGREKLKGYDVASLIIYPGN